MTTNLVAYSRNLSSQFWRPPTRHLGLSRVTLLPVILGENLSLTSSSFWWLTMFQSLWAGSLQSLPPLSSYLLGCVCLKTTLVIGFKTHHIIWAYLLISKPLT